MHIHFFSWIDIKHLILKFSDIRKIGMLGSHYIIDLPSTRRQNEVLVNTLLGKSGNISYWSLTMSCSDVTVTTVSADGQLSPLPHVLYDVVADPGSVDLGLLPILRSLHSCSCALCSCIPVCRKVLVWKNYRRTIFSSP